ncbi:DNA polymerase epsilon subunit 2 [Sitophilus oryzae]|uniref:DNA polymerase epsilon subunit n=1 Tax=Sitophilus oryzae TaxID=7048 RepID=A0A6J2XUP0_SITOR|nr:DNA polymerase epsilon subunit 2 [Sitophilus oryzae]
MAGIEKITKKLQNALKLSGFNIRSVFCSQIVEKFLSANINLNSKEIFNETVKNICVNLEQQCLSGHSIEQEHIDKILEVCLHSGYDHNETVFSVIRAFDFPKLYYNQDRKIYQYNPKKSKLLSDANVKAKMFLDRYSTVLQRTKRTFAQTLLNDEKNHLKLQTVDYLLTLYEVQLDRTLILGSLLQVSEGKYYIEDPTGIVELDLAHAKYHPGFYVENTFVLVNGFYEDKILHVSTVILPPGEDYAASRLTFGNINYFGGKSDVPLKDSKRLKNTMVENKDKMIVILSDVWLDHPQVFEKLDMLFNKMEQFVPPIAFVFMGNFLSESHGSEMMVTLKKLFKRLAEVISKYSIICNSSNFVFVPGLTDPCTPHIIPRLELPSYITEDVIKLLPNAVFTTNPCRIQYCNKEIAILRSDILAKLLQNSLYKPSREDIPKCITRTIISQGHFSPLSLNASTVHWDYDYCLSLYPLPDLVVIGDRSEAFKDQYKNCLVMNPGQFCTGDFPFNMYYPTSSSIEAIVDCCIDVDEEMEG